MRNRGTHHSLAPEPSFNEPRVREEESLRASLWREPIRYGLTLFLGVLATLLGLYLFNLLLPPPEPLTTRDVDLRFEEALASVTPQPALSATVYEFILPSLVYIKTSSVGPIDGNLVRSGEEMMKHAAGSTSTHAVADRFQGGEDDEETPDREEAFGFGSGVVVSADGMILTALHVVERAADIQVTFADGTRARGKIVAAEPDNDIAVLQADGLPEIFAPATLGNPNALRVGDEAYVVGNPIGLAGSMSSGVISGFNRTYRPPGRGFELTRLIQFDAAVNPGNSGGPLLNRNGEVIGIVVGQVNPMGQADFSGIGLAVRIDVAGGAAGAPPQ